ncbi:acyl-CoA-binding domain-containing protein 4 isoform X4 [Nannospalax galili]|uniref:acyl-CoA-binding domain-containing protein 4 isoform X4 n=1 Tax=Nannospalax galili TaxID=1026970 RepID=UPI0004ED1999|nr:acyl-CoA-binding domain-containing protein 4 isoform X4 [Nannospalax galili]
MGTEKEEPDCQKQFQAAVSVIQNLPKNGSYRPSYEEMLRFYSYYKQATMGPCMVPRPGFWDPIGRYKWDAWNSLGKMSREEAMSAYITEMKLVAQKVERDVRKGALSLTLSGWTEPVPNRDDETVPEPPPSHPKEPIPERPESQPPRDLDLEVFCDSLEQLEPELVKPSLLSLVPPVPELPHLYPGTRDSSQQVWAEQRGAVGRQQDTRSSPESPSEKDGLEDSLMGPQELDRWLVGTVQAMQESMRDVQRRLRSLESKPQLHEQQRPPRTRPWPLRLSAPTVLFFLLWPFIVQWLFQQFRTQKR